jgi:hypothetical protein
MNFQERKKEKKGIWIGMIYAYGVYFLGENIRIIKKTQKLYYILLTKLTFKKTQRNYFMFISRQQTTGQNHYIKVINKSFENVPKFKYLETTVTNKNCIHEEIKRWLNSENVS